MQGGRYLVALGLLLALAACNAPPDSPIRTPTPTDPAPVSAPASAPVIPPTPVPAPSPTEAQVQQGAQLYASICAQCHGAAGEGTSQGVALVGPRALPTRPRPGATLRTGSFKVAKDIGLFIKGSMPPGGPQRSMDEMKAVLAFLLQSNGVRLTQPITPAVAATIPWSR